MTTRQPTHQPLSIDSIAYMATTQGQWQSAAEAWDRWNPTIQAWLGPATEIMLALARVGPGDRVLDIATGGGEPAITAAKRVGPTGSVMATDISPNNVAFTQQAARAQGLTNVETRIVGGEYLDLPDASFDVVLARIGLIDFPDQPRVLGEMRRVLKPGGRVAGMVYSTPEHNRFYSIPIDVIRRRARLPPPLPGHPGPFSLGAAGVLEGTYRRAGFRDIQIRTVPAPLRMASADECVRFERESFGTIHQLLAGLPEAERVATWEEIAHQLRVFEGPDGFIGPCEMIIGVAVVQWQPRPEPVDTIVNVQRSAASGDTTHICKENQPCLRQSSQLHPHRLGPRSPLWPRPFADSSFSRMIPNTTPRAASTTR